MYSDETQNLYVEAKLHVPPYFDHCNYMSEG